MTSKKNALRFAVGTQANCQSSIWRLWVDGDDVYFCAKEHLRWLKVSLHASGRWRVAWVDKLEGPDSTSDRALYKWSRPDEFAPGWTGSVAVVVPALRPRLPLKRYAVDDSAVHWIQRPREARQLIFKLLFSAPQYSRDDLKGVMEPDDLMVGGIAKKDGEAVWVVVRDNEMTAQDIEFVKKVRQDLRINLSKGAQKDALLHVRAWSFAFPAKPDAATQPTIFDIGIGRESIRINR